MSPIEVFCKFDYIGNIFPIRMKIVNEDGTQVYDIKKSKLINIKFTNGVRIINSNLERFMDFECEIVVDELIKVVMLRFVIPEHLWLAKM